MNTALSHSIVAFVAVSMAACAAAPPPRSTELCADNQVWGTCTCEVPDALRALEKADPRADAEAALARRDFALLTVGGTGTPGVDSNVSGLYAGRAIPGTENSLNCYEKHRLQDVARAYAEVYNRAIVRAARPAAPAAAAK